MDTVWVVLDVDDDSLLYVCETEEKANSLMEIAVKEFGDKFYTTITVLYK